MGIEPPSTETCHIEISGRGVRITGTVSGEHGELSYAIAADPHWRFRALVIALGERSCRLERVDDEWTVDGEPRPDLAEAHEPDISASPVSNTLPIRRLDLADGQSADIVTAYVSVPELTVFPDPQRYTRLSRHEYLYESRDSDFRRTLTVDDDGFVVTYPGLFERAPG
jgi:hypothetical protein